MRVTIAEVARRARVSKTTVSRVLNNKSDVDAATATRVREVIAATGYTPSAGAVGLAKGVTHTVGMLVPGLTRPWLGELLQGIADVVESMGYGLLLNTSNRGEDSLARFGRQVAAHAFDGLLLIEPTNEVRRLRVLHDATLPVVVLDDCRPMPGFASVRTDHIAAGAAAARHFLAAGRRRLAVVTGPPELICTTEKQRGFSRALREAGVSLDGRMVVEGDFTADTGAEAIRQIVHAGLDFDGVFAHDDVTALGVLTGLRETGRSVPDDVAVIGFDDIPPAARAQPPLTTLHRPLRELGETAARLLLGRLNGSALPDDPLFVPAPLVVRESAP
jgi:LacI family transcriptional regulator